MYMKCQSQMKLVFKTKGHIYKVYPCYTFTEEYGILSWKIKTLFQLENNEKTIKVMENAHKSSKSLSKQRNKQHNHLLSWILERNLNLIEFNCKSTRFLAVISLPVGGPVSLYK